MITTYYKEVYHQKVLLLGYVNNSTYQRVQGFLAIHGARQHVGFVDDKHPALGGVDGLVHLRGVRSQVRMYLFYYFAWRYV